MINLFVNSGVIVRLHEKYKQNQLKLLPCSSKTTLQKYNNRIYAAFDVALKNINKRGPAQVGVISKAQK